jgi:hypothetical protein
VAWLRPGLAALSQVFALYLIPGREAAADPLTGKLAGSAWLQCAVTKGLTTHETYPSSLEGA